MGRDEGPHGHTASRGDRHGCKTGRLSEGRSAGCAARLPGWRGGGRMRVGGGAVVARDG